MSNLYEKVVRPVLFRSDPEVVHHRMITLLRLAGWLGPLCRWGASLTQGKRGHSIECFGLRFPNAIGLAAGMDKDGEITRALPAFGFGHIEVGTVTPGGQPGNPRPRVFRYPPHEALVNRMGFNNRGVEALVVRLRRNNPKGKRLCPIGINIGKSKETPISEAAQDYLESWKIAVEEADYIALNVSSPNTENLRELQQGDHLDPILGPLVSANRERSDTRGTPKTPILLKIAPDLSFREIDTILEKIHLHGIDGIIVSNTTIQRPEAFPGIQESGGLSGRPLRTLSTDLIRYVSLATGGNLPIIGVGGIMDAESAGEKIDAGATLFQIYTGWIYRGPFFPAFLARSVRPPALHRRSWI